MTVATSEHDGAGTPKRPGRLRHLPLPNQRPLDDPAVTFSDLLAGFRQRAGLAQTDLARRAGVNASYINRLESGERLPMPEVALALASGLVLTVEETDRLLWSAGHLPPSLRALVGGERTILAVARVLSDQRLSPAARAEFEACVEAMARRWGEELR